MLLGNLLLAIASMGRCDVSPDLGHVPGALILLLRDRQMLLALLHMCFGAHVDGAGSRRLVDSAGTDTERQSDPDIANHCDYPSLCRAAADRSVVVTTSNSRCERHAGEVDNHVPAIDQRKRAGVRIEPGVDEASPRYVDVADHREVTIS